MSWIPVLLTLPLPFLSAVLYERVKRKPEESFHLLRLNSLDVKIAFQLFGFGFLAMIIIVMSRIIGIDSTVVASLSGTALTLSLSIALIMLNLAVRPPGKYHHYLPGRRLKKRAGKVI